MMDADVYIEDGIIKYVYSYKLFKLVYLKICFIIFVIKWYFPKLNYIGINQLILGYLRFHFIQESLYINILKNK